MSRRERSGKPRYRRPPSAASSSETKEAPPVESVRFPPSSGLSSFGGPIAFADDRSGISIAARGPVYFVCLFLPLADLPLLQFPSVIAETQYETETKIVVQTQTVTVPPPANTRLAPPPFPESASKPSTPSSPRTTSILELVEEDEEEEDDDPRSNSISRGSRTSRKPPSRWLSGW